MENNNKETFKERMKRLEEEEKQEKLKKLTDYFQLTDLNESDLIVLQRITNSMCGNKLMHLGELLSFNCDAKTGYLNTIVEQNFMMIKQLSELNSKLDKIINKDE